MKELNSIIEDYLRQDKTDYALFINGEWGSGKTFYLKNELFSIISGIDSFVADKKNIYVKYIPLYISLFGVNEVSDIDKIILKERLPFLDSKAAVIASNVIGKVGGFFGLDTKIEVSDVLEVWSVPNNYVLCFDDLERLDNNLLKKVLGYINKLVEHNYIKAIIIGDENKIDKCGFLKIKEKLIRYTIAFVPDIVIAYDNIIRPYADDYREYLQNQKSVIIDLYKKAKHINLRTLQFEVNGFEKVFRLVSKQRYNDYIEILNRLLFFTTIYIIEYKKGAEKQQLDLLNEVGNKYLSSLQLDPTDFLLGRNNGQQDDQPQENPNEDYKDYIRSLYLDNGDIVYDYYKSIVDLVHTGYLSENDLLIESKNIQEEINRNKLTREIEILRATNSWNIMPDEEVQPMITEVLQEVKRGDFDLASYPSLFGWFIQLDYIGIISLDDNIKDVFKKGIDIAKSRAKYNPTFGIHIPIWQGEGSDKYSEIKEYAIKANNEIWDKTLEKLSLDLLEAIKNNDTDKINYFFQNDDYSCSPLFEKSSAMNFVDILINHATSRTIHYLDGYIYSRYAHLNTLDCYKEDLRFLLDVALMLKKYLDTEIKKPMTIKRYNIISFSKLIDKIQNEFYQNLQK